jgi:GntR family transcriptional regulator
MGETLPSIRPLAEQLRLNRNTVAKAYTELESQGVIETIAGKGCFLKDNHSPLRKDFRQKMLAEDIDAAIVQAHHLQFEPEEFLALARQRLEVFAAKVKASQSSTAAGKHEL